MDLHCMSPEEQEKELLDIYRRMSRERRVELEALICYCAAEAESEVKADHEYESFGNRR